MHYIAFLRGINLGGHHKVKMEELRHFFEQNGFLQVKTHIQSGNILFETGQSDESYLEVLIAKQLGERFGFAIPVRLRTMQEVIEMVHTCPFTIEEGDKRYHIYVSLLPEQPSGDHRTQLLAHNDPATIHLHGRELYALWERKPGETPSSMDMAEKLYKGAVTTRNMNVIRKLATM